mmetsp:Transcript_44233/g.103931  ORF Transcript_44233/g.103931 Transcript_44233/m.103931 type:complete len:170 (+) Transcript_44233:335-844(+)
MVCKAHVERLNVSSNGLGHQGTQHLATALMTPTNRVLELEIAFNGVGDAGATALGDMLARNTTLQRLRLTRNGIMDGGGAALVGGLSSNHTLTSLDLGANMITCLPDMKPGGASGLRKVDLSYNELAIFPLWLTPPLVPWGRRVTGALPCLVHVDRAANMGLDVRTVFR